MKGRIVDSSCLEKSGIPIRRMRPVGWPFAARVPKGTAPIKPTTKSRRRISHLNKYFH
jgi:hypothetical protein